MKRDVRSEILRTGAELVHRQGFNRTGLKDILDAARVPKGSFYFYFKSKEDFGLALIGHFRDAIGERFRPMLEDESLPPLARLRLLFSSARERFAREGCDKGCPVGNLAQEMSDLSPDMRREVKLALAGITQAIEGLLDKAAARGDIPASEDYASLASFILDAWEGALMRMKVEKSVEPLERFEEMIFSRLLG